MKQTLLLLLFPMLMLGQSIKVHKLGTTNDTILVIRNNEILKVPASYYNTLQDACPLFKKEQSTANYLLFESTSSIGNPNNSITVNGNTFISANAWIEKNRYYYSYTNVSGKPVNINQLLSVKFGNQICTYSNEN